MLVLASATSVINAVAGIATALGFLGAAAAIIQNGRTSRAANYLTLTQYLQDSETRAARTFILKRARADEEGQTAADGGSGIEGGSIPPRWGEMNPPDADATHAAGVVASSYDIAARAIQMGFVHKEPFLDDYGPSIARCWDYLEPFVAERRVMMGRARYWDNFERLADEVRRWERRNRQR